MASLNRRRHNKYETSPSTSCESGVESESRFAVESNVTSTIAASSGDASLNSSDVADIVKVSKSKMTKKKKKKKKKKNKKVNDNYLNVDEMKEEEDEEEDSFKNDVVEEETSTKSNLSKASIRSNISKVRILKFRKEATK